MALERELKTYLDNKQRLLAEASGKFVLIKGEEIIATYTSYNDALSEGYKKFGDTDFLVKEISQVDNVNYFSRPLVTA